ncbi:MAG: hypothetical protein MZU84_01740 [Sphingobacterium sp.]|nr:hypothetical protein [Sphingobacterium sp.]
MFLRSADEPDPRDRRADGDERGSDDRRRSPVSPAILVLEVVTPLLVVDHGRALRLRRGRGRTSGWRAVRTGLLGGRPALARGRDLFLSPPAAVSSPPGWPGCSVWGRRPWTVIAADRRSSRRSRPGLAGYAGYAVRAPVQGKGGNGRQGDVMSGHGVGQGIPGRGHGLRHRGPHPRDERAGRARSSRPTAGRPSSARTSSTATPSRAGRSSPAMMRGAADERLHHPEERPARSSSTRRPGSGTASTPASSSSPSRSPGTCPTSTAINKKRVKPIPF